MFNLTKIVATIGPASEKLAFLQQAQIAGLAVLRLNFSHGDHEEQLVRIQHAHQINETRTFNLLGVMLDTKGPELRVGKFKDDGQLFERDQTVKVYTTAERYRKLLCDTGEVTLSHNIATYVLPGTVLLLDDGKLQLVVNKKLPDHTGFLATAQNKHFLATNKRVNIPGVDFKLPFLSTRDRKDIHFGLQHKVDFIALSFVSGSADVLAVRRILKNKKMTHVKLISKIENQLAIDNLDDIITASDGIMVARGDLGLEIPYAEVPYWQAKIIEKCQAHCKFVIVATEMLDSMTKKPLATRAEVADVYHATTQHVDATMLSAESANGSFPLVAIQTMHQIIETAEGHQLQSQQLNLGSSVPRDMSDLLSHVFNLVLDGNKNLLVILVTNDYDFIRYFHYIGTKSHILVITSSVAVARACAILRSVVAYLVTDKSAQAQLIVQKKGQTALRLPTALIQLLNINLDIDTVLVDVDHAVHLVQITSVDRET